MSNLKILYKKYKLDGVSRYHNLRFHLTITKKEKIKKKLKCLWVDVGYNKSQIFFVSLISLWFLYRDHTILNEKNKPKVSFTVLVNVTTPLCSLDITSHHRYRCCWRTRLLRIHEISLARIYLLTNEGCYLRLLWNCCCGLELGFLLRCWK